jgi:hypothetical protein
VPVQALFDREAAHQVTLRNLLHRRGYESLEAVRTEAHEKGRKEGRALALASSVLTVLEARGISITEKERRRVRSCRDPETLDRWLLRAARADAAAAVFDAPDD